MSEEKGQECRIFHWQHARKVLQKTSRAGRVQPGEEQRSIGP
jgi:hypothetical protein